MTEEDIEIEDVDDESYYLRELSKLEKKLAIATKALKKLTRDCNRWGIARRAIQEIEEVK